MLTIQPNFTNSYSKAPSFGRQFTDGEYVDYEEVFDTPNASLGSAKSIDFDIDYEKRKTKNELDLWQQTKSNIDSIAKTTESVPALRTGTKVLSGLISVAIGWGGLRWGTVGTLEVLSKINKSSFITGLKSYMNRGGVAISNVYKDAAKYIKAKDWYKSAAGKVADMEKSALNSSAGQKYTEIKNSIKSSTMYEKAIKMKDDTVAYARKLNPKRIFVETMGIAGGGTAAVNTIAAGKAVDGNKYEVGRDEYGNFTINGRNYGGSHRHVA